MMTEDVLSKTVWDAEMKFNEIHSLFNDFLVLPDPGDFDGPMEQVTRLHERPVHRGVHRPDPGRPAPGQHRAVRR